MGSERLRVSTREAFDYDSADKEAVVRHLKEESRCWWERTGRDASPSADFAFGEEVWLAANGIEPDPAED